MTDLAARPAARPAAPIAARTDAPVASRAVQTVMHPLRARLLEVAATERIGPRMQRITLAGDQLDAFPFPAFAAGDHVKLVLPDPVTGRIPLPGVRDDRLAMPGDADPILRDYTVRAYSADGLVLDFVRHDHGPAGRWAIAAKVGDPIGVLGPRGSHLYPRDYARYVLVADETALPAVGRWLDEPGWTAEVEVFALAAEAGEYPLPVRPRTRVHWLEHPIGPNRADVLAEVAGLIADLDDTFVWAAGEAGSLKPFRRALRAAGVPREASDIDGYWKLGTAGLDHHLPDED
ncbi:MULTISPECIES: siderophore-interacting protein [Agromyces]|nr:MULTISPECIES: siderophore-interacting protein [Agromyces]UOE43232.1 siderophore-interacting protein [Agromyces larvae]